MKNLLIIIALWFGLGFYSVQAQSDQSEANSQYDEKSYNNNNAEEADDDYGSNADRDKTPAERKADREDKSKVGNALHETGSAIGSGAKWTWGKVKHNKLTKNVFNQPEDK